MTTGTVLSPCSGFPPSSLFWLLPSFEDENDDDDDELPSEGAEGPSPSDDEGGLDDEEESDADCKVKKCVWLLANAAVLVPGGR